MGWCIRPVDPTGRHRGPERLDQDAKEKMPVEMPRIFRDEDRQAKRPFRCHGVVARRAAPAWSAACMTLSGAVQRRVAAVTVAMGTSKTGGKGDSPGITQCLI